MMAALFPARGANCPSIQIMRPNCESPSFAAHKIRVEVSDSQIVNSLGFAGVEDILDRQAAPVKSHNRVAHRNRSRGDPAFVIDKERMLRRGPDHLACNVQMQNSACPDKNGL